MATTDNATTPKTTKRKPAAKTAAKRKPTAKTAATRKPATTRAAAKKPATASRATSTSTRPATRAAQVQQLAERAVLIPLGAALEARDRVGDIVTTTRSRSELEKQLARFERRGGGARTQLEREVRRTRTRLERETRNARRGIDRQRSEARRMLQGNVEDLSSRVENVVQTGVNAGRKLVNGAQDRLPKVA